MSLSERLIQSGDDAGAVLELGFTSDTDSEEVEVKDAEVQLWSAACSIDPKWQLHDRERGRIYGTAARCLAFASRWDEARELCMRARSFFGGSPFDLVFNASVLARIELDRLRELGGGVSAIDSEVLVRALELAGTFDIAKPRRVREHLRNPEDPVRFALDLLLRSLLWVPDHGPLQLDSWLAALEPETKNNRSIFSLLSSGELRSHPSELIARHAGELLRANGEEGQAQSWFGLSIELCSSSGTDSTLHRMGKFTRRLGSDPSFLCDGPVGSIFNPTFEYR